MVAVTLPDIMYGSTMFENLLSFRVLEWIATLVDCKIKGTNEASESKNALVGLCSL